MLSLKFVFLTLIKPLSRIMKNSFEKLFSWRADLGATQWFLNTGILDWEARTLTTKPLLCDYFIYQPFNRSVQTYATVSFIYYLLVKVWQKVCMFQINTITFNMIYQLHLCRGSSNCWSKNVISVLIENKRISGYHLFCSCVQSP